MKEHFDEIKPGIFVMNEEGKKYLEEHKFKLIEKKKSKFKSMATRILEKWIK